jgi:hypothetical protein
MNLQLIQRQEVRQDCRLKKLTLTVDGNVMELHHGHFGYFKCSGCENECERQIDWEKLFCLVCPSRKDCHQEGKIEDRREESKNTGCV